MRRQGIPIAATRVVGATNSGMVPVLRHGGVHELGEVTSGIAQGCPWVGVLFLRAMDPVGRRLLRVSRAVMLRQRADDTAVIMRAAQFIALLAPIFRDTDKFDGVRFKPAKCDIVLIGRDRGEVAKAAVAAQIARVDTGWRDFRIGEAGEYLSISLGPLPHGLSWTAPVDSWRARAAQMASRGTPAFALPQHSTCTALDVLHYVDSMIEHPDNLSDIERHVVGRLFHLPGSACLRRGHTEQTREWGWPSLPSVEAAVAVYARTRSERTRATQATREPIEAIFGRTLESRPLADLIGEVAVDRQWLGDLVCRWQY